MPNEHDAGDERHVRANRLREQIERLKKGESPPQEDRPKSLREQIEEREREPPSKSDRE
jgi:hypothetical protein